MKEFIRLVSIRGLDLVQFSLENQVDIISPRLIRECANVCSKEGKKLAFHAPAADLTLGSRNAGIRQESIRQISESIKLVGPYAEFITLHTGLVRHFAPRESLDLCVDALSQLVFTARQHQAILSIENMYEQTVDELLDYLRLVETDSLKITFDLAHSLLYSRMLPRIALSVLSPHLIDIHLSRPIRNRDSHYPLDSKWKPLREVLSILKGSNYLGYLTVEALNLNEGKSALQALQRIC